MSTRNFLISGIKTAIGILSILAECLLTLKVKQIQIAATFLTWKAKKWLDKRQVSANIQSNARPRALHFNRRCL